MKILKCHINFVVVEVVVVVVMVAMMVVMVVVVMMVAMMLVVVVVMVVVVMMVVMMVVVAMVVIVVVVVVVVMVVVMMVVMVVVVVVVVVMIVVVVVVVILIYFAKLVEQRRSDIAAMKCTALLRTRKWLWCKFQAEVATGMKGGCKRDETDHVCVCVCVCKISCNKSNQLHSLFGMQKLSFATLTPPASMTHPQNRFHSWAVNGGSDLAPFSLELWATVSAILFTLART